MIHVHEKYQQEEDRFLGWMLVVVVLLLVLGAVFLCETCAQLDEQTFSFVPMSPPPSASVHETP